VEWGGGSGRVVSGGVGGKETDGARGPRSLCGESDGLGCVYKSDEILCFGYISSMVFRSRIDIIII
jgi:hypothetical protein